MTLDPSASIVDMRRTIYWQGTGDYGSYVDGRLVYTGSGTQYAYMYGNDFASSLNLYIIKRGGRVSASFFVAIPLTCGARIRCSLTDEAYFPKQWFS